MRRTFLATMGVAAVLALGATTASAGFVMFIDDLATVGVIDVIIADGGVVGTWTSIGLSTIADPAANGFMTHTGAVGPFLVTVSTGVSKPLIGPNRIELSNLSVSGGAGTLVIGLTDTGFLGAGIGPAPWSLINEIGGTTQGTVTSSFEADIVNREFGLPAGPPIFGPFAHAPFGPGAFSGTMIAPGFNPLGVVPFSISNSVSVFHPAAGLISSFDSLTSVIPAPGAALLGVIGLGLVGRMKRWLS